MPLTAVRPRTAASRATARHTPLGPGEAAVLRTVADARTPVFVTVREGGRRRYSYWRPLDSATGRGGCYVALPTAECDALHAAGRITLGDPVADPARTTYRVRATRTPAAPVRALPQRERAA
ncbi:hypothetical protein ACFWR9_10025 [Streptomyces sp. NPDC058534]|uniref:hypothetical protein n=1 Tax=Streptomyces sp. NPDC058534 TaxID=3346541 RepID=UPI0036675615